MTERAISIAAAAALLVATVSWGQELRVDLKGTGDELSIAAVDLRLDEVRLIGRTHRGTGRTVAGADTELLSVGPLRLVGLARILMVSPLGLYPWSAALTAASGPRLDAAQIPSGRVGVALRAADGLYLYALRRSETLARVGAGASFSHDSGLAAELAAVVSRLQSEPGSARSADPSEPRARMIHAAARLSGAGELLEVTAVPIVMAVDALPPAGAGIVSAALAADWLTLGGSLALASERYFTGDAKAAAGATAALRVRAAGEAGQSLELRSQWRAGASAERVLSARLTVGSGTRSGLYGSAEVSHRRTLSSDRARFSARAEARDGGNRGWLSGSVSTSGSATTPRIEVGARLQASPALQLTVAVGRAKEWSFRVEGVLRIGRQEVELDLDDDGDWGLGLLLRR